MEFTLEEIDQIRYLFANMIADKNKKNRNNKDIQNLKKKLTLWQKEKESLRFFEAPKGYIETNDGFQKVAIIKLCPAYAHIEYVKKSSVAFNTSTKVSKCVMLDEIYNKREINA